MTANNIEIDFGNDGFKINAELKMDGDKWCVGVGVDLQRGCYAFHKTPTGAIHAFKNGLRNYKPSKPKEPLSGTNEALDKLGITRN